jgi:hypothetical protein
MMAGVRLRFRVARLRRSVRDLDRLMARIPREVPEARDINWREVRQIAPALLARCHAPELPATLLQTVHAPRSNFAFIAGLAAALDSAMIPSQRLRAMAHALGSMSFRWVIPSACRRKLLLACGSVEWDSVPSDLALAALSAAFRLKRSIPLWRRLLGELARAERWAAICSEIRAHPRYTYLVRAELRRSKDALDCERIWAAELIALARYETADRSRGLARSWFLPLVERSTERFLPRGAAARRLSEQLKLPSHVKADELAPAIERGIAPNDVDDYSNFRKAFAEETWEQLHGAFSNWAIFTELERFACELDRARFWRHIESTQSRIKRRSVQ